MDDARLTPPRPAGVAVWITRALPGAGRTAAAVAALGFVPIVEPLVEVRALPVAAPDLDGVTALAFTSAAGVRAFAALTPARDLPVFAVGDATAEVARALGWSTVASAAGDVRALDALLARAAPPGRILAPGAVHPAGRLRHAERWPLYDIAFTPGPWPQARAALAQARLGAVLVHSPSAGRALAASGLASPAAEALALSAACAAPLDRGAWAALRLASSPDDASLLALLNSTAPDSPPWQPPQAPL